MNEKKDGLEEAFDRFEQGMNKTIDTIANKAESILGNTFSSILRAAGVNPTVIASLQNIIKKANIELSIALDETFREDDKTKEEKEGRGMDDE